MFDKWKAKYGPTFFGMGINVYSYVNLEGAAKKAMSVFRTPRKGRIRSHEQKFLKKFKQTTLHLGNADIAVYDNDKEGNTKTGKTVLLCHGWESNAYRWRKLYRVLQNTDHRIIMMDAPAHGGTSGDLFDGELYANYIDVVAQEYKPDVIVGHSIGGFSVLYYAYIFKPTFLKSLIIMASPDKMEDITYRYFDMIGLANRVRTKYDDVFTAAYKNPLSHYNAANFAKNIPYSGLVIHDKNDRINLFYEGEAIAESWKDSEFMKTEELGHSLQDESVYNRIKDYLAKD